MTDQKCPYCSAPLIRGSDWHGEPSFRCQYCGNTVTIRPEKVTDKVLTFANRLANALSNKPSDPVERAKYEQKKAEIMQKSLQIREEYLNKELEKLQRKKRRK